MKKAILVVGILIFLAWGVYAKTAAECDVLINVNDSCQSGLIVRNFSIGTHSTFGICVNADGSSACDPMKGSFQTCKSEGEMCGGIAGFQCCSGLNCQLEGDFPDASGFCVTNQTQNLCENLCGDGACQEIVCQGEGCPCEETAESCPSDCKESPRSGGLFNNFFIYVLAAVLFVLLGFKFLKWAFWTLAILTIIIALFWFKII